MKRSLYIRLFIVVVVTSASVLLFSYVRAHTTHSEEQQPCNEGKCSGDHDRSGRAKSEIILWESLTHNLLATNR